ncbi:MAG: FadR/GntR family transcriptional regulator [Betaproteobacteria bacterium]
MKRLLLQDERAGSLPDRIYAGVVEAILRGDFAPSGKLPTEADLAVTFGVSRPTVREALSRLRADRIIDSRRGAGSYVIRQPGAPAASATPIKNLADIERYYEFRSCVESGAAAAAAEYGDAGDLAAVRAAFDDWVAAMEDGGAGVEEDLRFHLAIARASHNPFFVTTLEASIAPIRHYLELARYTTDKKSPARIGANRAEHQAIMEAIARRSPADAADAVRTHILNAKRRIFESTPMP